MKRFLAPRRRMTELLLLGGLDLVLWLVWRSTEGMILFSLGFIWNWVACQDLGQLFENRRYRFSMVKLVVNLQGLWMRPFGRLPLWAQAPVKALPAGIFWTLVIWFNDSEMPWWFTFLGSLAFELNQWDSWSTAKSGDPA